MNFISELKRRNVIRMAGLYLIGAWLITQVAATLLPVFEAPGWVMKTIVGILAIGFVPAMVFAWVFELTPDGLKRDSEIPEAQSIAPQTARKMERSILVLFAIALAFFAFDKFYLAPKRDVALLASTAQAAAASDTPRSIAVLAFDDLSAEGDQAYLAEGVSEELLNLLARIDGLKVAARTSSFKFKNSDADIGEIGRALKVDAVLEGSIRKSGNEIRVTAQLIKVSDGFRLWNGSYQRKLDDIFVVQDEISAAFVSALRLELDANAPAVRTANVAAYEHYLQGRLLAREPIRANLLAAVARYEQAITLDPGFAAPYGGLAESWVMLADYGGVPRSEAFPRAGKAARRALEIDPQSAEALTAIALLRDMDNDTVGASTAFEAALLANPSYVPAYNLYADMLRDKGDMRRMLEMQQRAAELDPLSIYMKSRVANKLLAMGRFDEAGRAIDIMLVAAPNNDFVLEEAANLAASRGYFAKAVETYQRVHASRLGDAYSAARITIVAAWMQDRPLADRALKAARARGAGNSWELLALAELADWQREPAQLDTLGRQDGPLGAWWRARRATVQSDLPQARVHLLEALRLSGYDAGKPPLAIHIPALIELARVERELGQATWQATLQVADAGLKMVSAQESVRLNVFEFVAYGQARVHALRGEREQALVQLRRAVAQGYARHWFLANDPVFAPWRTDPEFTALVSDMDARAAVEKAKLAGKVIIL